MKKTQRIRFFSEANLSQFGTDFSIEIDTNFRFQNRELWNQIEQDYLKHVSTNLSALSCLVYDFTLLQDFDISNNNIDIFTDGILEPKCRHYSFVTDQSLEKQAIIEYLDLCQIVTSKCYPYWKDGSRWY